MKLTKILSIVTLFMFLSGNVMAQSNTFMHTIEKGQSLYSIASMYNVSIDDIIRENPGSDKGIQTGKQLRIPQQNGQHGSRFHTVQSGETLYKLSVANNVSVERICQANPGLTVANFKAGQVIVIPPSILSEQPTQEVTPKVQPSTGTPTPKSNFQDIHRVEKKETIYSISRKYGITEAELIAANPELRSGTLRKGSFLTIPHSANHKISADGSMEKSAEYMSDAELIQQHAKPTKALNSLRIALMLPFQIEQVTNRDEQSKMIEYYEGFLMAVQEIKRQGTSVDLYTFDAKNTSTVKALLEKDIMRDVDLIIGPTNAEQVALVADFAKKNKIRFVIPFTSRSNVVYNNPYVYQINTPQSYLYSEVYEHLLRKFGKCNVIFLDPLDGSKDKADFIKGLKEELLANHIEYQTISGESIITENIKMMMKPDMNNLFIPTSGNNPTLIQILPQLVVSMREMPDYQVTLFGYPEWQTYTADHIESFYELGTYFYSSFYTNNLFPEAIKFTTNFRKWYSKDMANTYPKYGMLGYDTGYFFLKGLSIYGNGLDANLHKVSVTPIQTAFKFERVNTWGGFINKKVFFVNFTKNYELLKLDFD